VLELQWPGTSCIPLDGKSVLVSWGLDRNKERDLLNRVPCPMDSKWNKKMKVRLLTALITCLLFNSCATTPGADAELNCIRGLKNENIGNLDWQKRSKSEAVSLALASLTAPQDSYIAQNISKVLENSYSSDSVLFVIGSNLITTDDYLAFVIAEDVIYSSAAKQEDFPEGSPSDTQLIQGDCAT